MKKLINSVNSVVPEMLEGIVRMSPDLLLMPADMIVVDAASADRRKAGQVALISGGGAGHEPAHAGYVGAGMLSAAVSGDVFSSPSVDAVLAGIRAVAGPAGVLLIVKSYTGDRLNFGLAAELARADGIPAEMVIVGDDVSLPANQGAGRRGIAGTVLVHKVAGAAAAAGLTLAQVRQEAQAAADAVGTMGVGLTPCTVPAAGSPSFDLGDDEIELGLGIHGEAGVERTAKQRADVIVDQLIGKITADRGIKSGDRVALLVNNLGGTPTMELFIVARRALELLGERGIRVERAWCGSFLTALEMAGCSLSLLPLDDQRLARLDAPTRAMAWPRASGELPSTLNASEPPTLDLSHFTPGAPAANLAAIQRAIFAACTALEKARDHLTALDQVVGDGDIGISLSRGAAAVQREFATYDHRSAAGVLRGVSATLRRVIGGTSGPLYAIFLLRGAAALDGKANATPSDWAAAFAAGALGIAEIGGARVGDRTMLDALIPASDAFAAAVESGAEMRQVLEQAVVAAEVGRDATAQMAPRRGRSSYMGERALGHVDPGAEAVAIWLRAMNEAASG